MIGYLLLGLLLMAALLVVLEWWARAKTKDAKRTLMYIGIAITALIALFFIARGQWIIGALPVALTVSRFFGFAQRALWLSRLFGQGREHFQNQQRGGGSGTARSSSSDLSTSEALQILGLQEGATRDDIQQAYKKLMEQVHPDRGGNDWLAERLNAARDRLLK